MAVFTKLTSKDFRKILSEYSIGEFSDFKGISEGVENTNYILKVLNKSGKIVNYILTIYEKRVDEKDLPFFLNLQKNLNESGFLCPKPIENNNRKIINKFNSKSYTIVSFINGGWPRKIQNYHVEEAARSLANLHLNTNKFKTILNRKNSMDVIFWKETYEKVSKQAENKYRNLKTITEKTFKEINKAWPENIESGIIHADYFPDNVMFDKKRVSGVIDFYMSCNDLYAYDLAIAFNAWCFESDHSFNTTKAKIFLNSYNEIRKLSKEEVQALPVLCIGASMRFLSTRLYDYFNTPEDSEVKIKDPREYIEKLKFHLQVKSHTEYGI